MIIALLFGLCLSGAVTSQISNLELKWGFVVVVVVVVVLFFYFCVILILSLLYDRQI